MILGVRTVQGRAYGAQAQQRERTRLVALRVPESLLQRITAKMRAAGETKTSVMVQAMENGL